MEEPSQSTQQQRMDDMISQWTDTSTRLPTWIALTILSMVSFVSMLYQRHAWTDAWGWAFAVTSLSVICGVICYFAYLKYKAIFVGQLPEYSPAASAVSMETWHKEQCRVSVCARARVCV